MAGETGATKPGSLSEAHTRGDHVCEWRETCDAVGEYARALLSVLESTSDAVVPCGLDRSITGWNLGAQKMLGYRYEEIVGRPESTVWADDSLDAITYRRVVETGQPTVNVETRCRHASGRIVNVVVTRTAVKDFKGRLQGTCLFLKDLSSERRRRRSAEQAEKMSVVGKMAAALAHEIRNPLNSMNLQLVLMERALLRLALKTDPLKESVAVIREEVGRLDGLLNEFLEYARPIEMFVEPVDVGLLLDDVIAVGIPSDEGKVAVKRLVVPQALSVQLDRRRMKQALLNLVRNSVEAMPRGGKLVLSAAYADGEVRFEVNDTGVGISDEARGHIFDLFFTTKESGTGLGLAIVQQLVELHGGMVEVESTEDVGTTVRVRIPAKLEA